MFRFEDLRNTRVWQEAREEGENFLKVKLIHQWLAEGKSAKEIAQLLDIPIRKVRELAKNSSS